MTTAIPSNETSSPSPSTSLPEDTLCRSCRAYIIGEFLERRNTEAGKPPAFIERDIMPMQHLYECTTCPACVFILKIVLMTPGAREASEGGKGMVVLTKEEFGRYEIQGRAGPAKRVDRIFVQLTFGIDTFTTRVEGTVFARGFQLLAKNQRERELTEENSHQDLLLGRRINQFQVDMDLVHSWLNRCCSWHAQDCVPRIFQGQFPLRLIDVQRECIVMAPSDAKYVALSYTWGSPEQREKEGGLGVFLDKATYGPFSEPGGLAKMKERMPTSIADSMLFCEMLGVEYLWVDALCIRQDDKADKRVQLPNMHFVYGGAYLTIVAAAGKTSWAGLPGVRPRSRDAPQHTTSVGGVDIISIARPFITSVKKSAWNTRAWTYEEKILSVRLLIFTEYQVFFHCNKAIWYEDAVLEAQDPPFSINQLQFEDMKDGNNLRMLKTLPGESSWSHYRQTVLGYTARNLTHSRDCLNAFLGIAAALRQKLDGDFIWGLPEDVFDYALAWLWRAEPRPHARNLHAPSWSWASWLDSQRPGTNAGVGSWPENPSKARRIVLFFRHDPSSQKLVLVQSSIPPISRTARDDLGLPLPAVTRIPSEPPHLEQLPEVLLNTDSQPRVLHRLYFWARTVLLTVDYHRYDSWNERWDSWFDGSRIPKGEAAKGWRKDMRGRDLTAPYQRDVSERKSSYRIRNARGRAIGTVSLEPQWRQDRPKQLEFAAFLGYTEPNRVLTMLIERRDNLAFRIQRTLTLFAERDWLETRPDWSLITLC